MELPRHIRLAASLSVCFALACVPSTSAEPLPSSEPVSDTPSQAAEAGAELEIDIAPVESAPAKPSYEPRPEDLVTVHHPLDNPEALAPFFDALAAIDNGERRLVRVLHVGASAIGADDLPSVMRERFQARFGDGGAGLVLMSRYTNNYLNRWVELEASGWEHCYLAYKCLTDGRYGLGGTAFWASSGATTTVSTRKAELGDEASKVELWYLARPGGGRVEVKIDKREAVIVDTRSETTEDRWQAFEVEPGPHTVRVRTVGYGPSRLYGLTLETDSGVVWDGVSKLGVFTSRVLDWNAEHIADQIGHRDVDLIVFAYGGNDLRRVANGKLGYEDYVAEFRAAVEHLRRGKPEAACLVTAVNDRGKSLTFDIEAEHVEVIVDAQREVARQTGCAFFDTYAAMGGPGSFSRWRHQNPPLAAPDQKHLNHAGRVVLGGWMYDAIIGAYVEHRRRG